MAIISITIERVIVRQDDELLKEIICKLDKLLKTSDDTAIIVKATEDLKAGSDELKSAVEKNTQ